MRASTVELYGEGHTPPPRATSISRAPTPRSGRSPNIALVRPMPTRDEAIEIAVDDQRVAGTLVTPATVIPGVLFVHGWGASQEQYLARAQQIAALGCVCLTFDLRGHARDELEHERVTREDNLRDVVAAYDLLAGAAGGRRHGDRA